MNKREYDNEYYYKNRDKKLQQIKDNYHEHKDEISKRRKELYKIKKKQTSNIFMILPPIIIKFD